MTRSKKLATFASLAGIMLSAIAVPVIAMFGCNEAVSREAPDANPPPCSTKPAIFCNVVPPEAPGCNVDEGRAALLRKVPPATRYGIGCVINGPGSRDNQGDCSLDSVCKCINGVTTQPSETTDPDGGAVIPTTGVAPTWACDPP